MRTEDAPTETYLHRLDPLTVMGPFKTEEEAWERLLGRTPTEEGIAALREEGWTVSWEPDPFINSL